jgi:hypothetical protein
VRLIRRNQPERHSLEEGECYERTYRENLLGNVDLVSLEHHDVPIKILSDAESPRLTSRTLKRQFEERLAARARNRPSRES